jgi:hypothetical protein
MMRSRNKKALAIIIVILFITIAGGIAATLAILMSTELRVSIQNYRSELAFYAADSGVARGKELFYNSNNWRPWKTTGGNCPTSGSYGCAAGELVDSCTFCTCGSGCDCTEANCEGGCYIEDKYHVPRTGGNRLEVWYRVNIEDYTVGESDKTSMVIDSGVALEVGLQ